MVLAIKTGWSLEYIYEFDYDDYVKVVETLNRLEGAGNQPKQSRVIAPSEFIKKYN